MPTMTKTRKTPKPRVKINPVLQATLTLVRTTDALLEAMGYPFADDTVTYKHQVNAVKKARQELASHIL